MDMGNQIREKFLKEENDRDERVQNKFFKMIMDRYRRVLNTEYSGHTTSEKMRKRLIMEPLDLMERSFVRISLAYLYRRYRQIRIQALTEAISIVHTEGQRDDAIRKIRDKIIEIGVAHKESKERQKQEKQEKALY